MTDACFFPATAMPDWDWWRQLWPDPEGVLGELGVAAGMAAVDLCCGDGYFTAPLSRMVGVDGRVYGLDIDPRMLAAARAHVDNHGLDNCVWIEADALDLAGHVPEAIDLVLIANTFHGVGDKTGLARRAAGVLRPGGSFCIVNWHARPREETPVLGQPRGPATEMRLSPAAVGEAVEPAGFVLGSVVELPPYHYGAVFRKQGD